MKIKRESWFSHEYPLASLNNVKHRIKQEEPGLLLHIRLTIVISLQSNLRPMED